MNFTYLSRLGEKGAFGTRVLQMLSNHDSEERVLSTRVLQMCSNHDSGEGEVNTLILHVYDI